MNKAMDSQAQELSTAQSALAELRLQSLQQKQASTREVSALKGELQAAQANLEDAEARMQQLATASDKRVLRARADAEQDLGRHTLRAGDLEARIAELEAQWEAERQEASQQARQSMSNAGCTYKT